MERMRTVGARIRTHLSAVVKIETEAIMAYNKIRLIPHFEQPKDHGRTYLFRRRDSEVGVSKVGNYSAEKCG